MVCRCTEEDLVFALAAVVTQEGRVSSGRVLLAIVTDREIVLRLMNAVARLASSRSRWAWRSGRGQHGVARDPHDGAGQGAQLTSGRTLRRAAGSPSVRRGHGVRPYLLLQRPASGARPEPSTDVAERIVGAQGDVRGRDALVEDEAERLGPGASAMPSTGNTVRQCSASIEYSTRETGDCASFTSNESRVRAPSERLPRTSSAEGCCR